jgi:hypothetical protein
MISGRDRQPRPLVGFGNRPSNGGRNSQATAMTMRREDIKSDRLRRLFDYWQSKRADRKFPGRADIDPMDFRYILGNVAMADVERDPWRFHFRLVGTEIARWDGADLTGRTTEDHPLPEYRTLLHKVYRQTVEAAEPSCYVRDRMFDGRMRRYEVLYLPLASDGETIDMLLVGMEFPPFPWR